MKAIARSLCFVLALTPFAAFSAPEMPAMPTAPSVPTKAVTPAVPAVPAAATAIDINSADATQLEALPGIGPTKSKAIVDYRTKNGPFQSVADLEKVPGIGPKTMEQLAPLIMVKPSLPAVPGVKK